jgi:undecaprenyl-diphosphatase
VEGRVLSTFEAIILGIIQGLTEFLPVSSSGHLALGQYFFGFENLNQYVLFDVVCHLGTLCSIFFVFHSEIKEMLFKKRVIFLQIVLATLFLFPMVFLIKEIKLIFNQLQYLGFFFLITALLLYLGTRFGYEKTASQMEKSRWRDPLAIGLFQTLALLPGVSRSGATISAARLMGWETEKAINFSFLLAIPAILGATAIEFLQLIIHDTPKPDISVVTYLSGFLTSLFVGYFALLLLKRLADKKKFHYFVWYCGLLGILTLFTFNLV